MGVNVEFRISFFGLASLTYVIRLRSCISVLIIPTPTFSSRAASRPQEQVQISNIQKYNSARAQPPSAPSCKQGKTVSQAKKRRHKQKKRRHKQKKRCHKQNKKTGRACHKPVTRPPPIHRHTLISSPPRTSSKFARTFAFPSTTASTRPHSRCRVGIECSSCSIKSRSCTEDK